jgi:hypothetical protein
MSQELLNNIDNAAVDCCSLMDATDKENFFQFQEGRVKDGSAAPAKYRCIRTYFKGERKGQEKEVFSVDGRKFNKLWNMLKPYAQKSVARSYYFKDSIYLEDELEEIKYQVLFSLRYYGPSPNNIRFSKHFPLIVKNTLTNSAFSRNESSTSMVNFNTISFSTPLGSNGEDGELELMDIMPSDSFKEEMFNHEVPDDLKEPVSYLMEGLKLEDVAKELRRDKEILKNRLMQFILS